MNRDIIKKLLLGDAPEQVKEKYLTGTASQEEIIGLENIKGTNRPTGWFRGRAESMIGYTCLENIEILIDEVVKNKIPGDFIETGVWAGGACIYAKKLFDAHGEKRKVFVADSFEGLPKPELDRYPQDLGDIHHTYDILRVPPEEVENNFKRYNCLDENVILLKGWFKDTLPKLSSDQKFCIIRLDGDMYSSTMDAITNLYPKLSKGGYCIIDDYALVNCAAAVNDYRKQHNITSEFKLVPDAGAGALYWKKDE